MGSFISRGLAVVASPGGHLPARDDLDGLLSARRGQERCPHEDAGRPPEHRAARLTSPCLPRSQVLAISWAAMASTRAALPAECSAQRDRSATRLLSAVISCRGEPSGRLGWPRGSRARAKTSWPRLQPSLKLGFFGFRTFRPAGSRLERTSSSRRPWFWFLTSSLPEQLLFLAPPRAPRARAPNQAQQPLTARIFRPRPLLA